MNKVLTVTGIEGNPYEFGPNKSYRVRTREGTSFTLSEEDAVGYSIGSKIRYSLTLLGHAEASEIDDAYVTIASLVERGHELAIEARAAVLAKRGLAASILLNLVAIAWLAFK